MSEFVVPEFACVACGKPIPSAHRVKLFCSDLCKEMAKYVRYHRSCIKDGRDKDPEVRKALRVRFFFILAGGYKKLQRYIPERTRKAVLERDFGKCQICGKDGNQLDHIDGNSNEAANLQVLCFDCHLKKTLGTITLASGEERLSFQHSLRTLELESRIESEHLECPCDDEATWMSSWKSIVDSRRKEHFRAVAKFVSYSGVSGELRVREYLISHGIVAFSGSEHWSKESVRAMLKHLPFDDDANS